MKADMLNKENIVADILKDLKKQNKINYMIIFLAVVIAINGIFLSDLTFNQKYLANGIGFAVFIAICFGMRKEYLEDFISDDKMQIIYNLKSHFSNKEIKVILVGTEILLIDTDEKRAEFSLILNKAIENANSLTNEDFYYVISVLRNKFATKTIGTDIYPKYD